jgi:hypothetical protein
MGIDDDAKRKSSPVQHLDSSSAMAPPATPVASKKRAVPVAPVRTKYRAWDTAIAVSLTMLAYFSWQLSSDPGLGGMFLDSMCSNNHECAVDWVGDRVAIRGLHAK